MKLLIEVWKRLKLWREVGICLSFWCEVIVAGDWVGWLKLLLVVLVGLFNQTCRSFPSWIRKFLMKIFGLAFRRPKKVLFEKKVCLPEHLKELTWVQVPHQSKKFLSTTWRNHVCLPTFTSFKNSSSHSPPSRAFDCSRGAFIISIMVCQVGVTPSLS